VLGRDLAEVIIPPELRDSHDRGVARHLATGEGPLLGKRVEVVGLRSDGSRIPLELAISPIQIPGRLYFTAYLRDLTERNRSIAALRESDQRLAATYEHAFAGIAEVDPTGRFLRVNEQLCAMTGYSREELLRLTFQELTHPDERAEDEARFRRQMVGELQRYALEKRYVHKDGHEIWIELLASRVDDEAGLPLYGIRITRDISERKRAERRRQLLINELNHRVKNTLATVQSIVAQSLKNASSPEQARDLVEARLHSLSRAHDVLTQESWEGADLREIVAQALKPFRAHPGERFLIDVPEVRVPPALALTLSLVLHELSTNAVKYGALSSSTGIVRINCTKEQEAELVRIKLSWREEGGPPLAGPKRRGFGSRLIERSFGEGSGGSAQLSFLPTGCLCVLEVQFRQQQKGAAWKDDARDGVIRNVVTHCMERDGFQVLTSACDT
jgi:PAS domain S-box-containing protein